MERIQAAIYGDGRIQRTSFRAASQLLVLRGGAIFIFQPDALLWEVLMHIQTTTHLMIAGSRYATREMLDYARRAVQRAHQLGWTILVGDNPKGVDMAAASRRK